MLYVHSSYSCTTLDNTDNLYNINNKDAAAAWEKSCLSCSCCLSCLSTRKMFYSAFAEVVGQAEIVDYPQTIDGLIIVVDNKTLLLQHCKNVGIISFFS